MTTLTPQQAILIGYIVSPVIFALCVYFTRAGLRRTAGSLVGVFAYCLGQVSGSDWLVELSVVWFAGWPANAG